MAALIVLVVLLVMAFGVFGFVALFRMDGKQKKAEKNADEILDTTFDGRPDVAVKVNMQGLKYETYVIGAKQRGYKVANDGTTNGYGSLIFEKA